MRGMEIVLHIGLCFTILLSVSSREEYDDDNDDHNNDTGSLCSVILSVEHSKPCGVLLLN